MRFLYVGEIFIKLNIFFIFLIFCANACYNTKCLDKSIHFSQVISQFSFERNIRIYDENIQTKEKSLTFLSFRFQAYTLNLVHPIFYCFTKTISNAYKIFTDESTPVFDGI